MYKRTNIITNLFNFDETFFHAFNEHTADFHLFRYLGTPDGLQL